MGTLYEKIWKENEMDMGSTVITKSGKYRNKDIVISNYACNCI